MYNKKPLPGSAKYENSDIYKSNINRNRELEEYNRRNNRHLNSIYGKEIGSQQGTPAAIELDRMHSNNLSPLQSPQSRSHWKTSDDSYPEMSMESSDIDNTFMNNNVYQNKESSVWDHSQDKSSTNTDMESLYPTLPSLTSWASDNDELDFSRGIDSQPQVESSHVHDRVLGKSNVYYQPEMSRESSILATSPTRAPNVHDSQLNNGPAANEQSPDDNLEYPLYHGHIFSHGKAVLQTNQRNKLPKPGTIANPENLQPTTASRMYTGGADSSVFQGSRISWPLQNQDNTDQFLSQLEPLSPDHNRIANSMIVSIDDDNQPFDPRFAGESGNIIPTSNVVGIEQQDQIVQRRAKEKHLVRPRVDPYRESQENGRDEEKLLTKTSRLSFESNRERDNGNRQSRLFNGLDGNSLPSPNLGSLPTSRLKPMQDKKRTFIAETRGGKFKSSKHPTKE